MGGGVGVLFALNRDGLTCTRLQTERGTSHRDCGTPTQGRNSTHCNGISCSRCSRSIRGCSRRRWEQKSPMASMGYVCSSGLFPVFPANVGDAWKEAMHKVLLVIGDRGCFQRHSIATFRMFTGGLCCGRAVTVPVVGNSLCAVRPVPPSWPGAPVLAPPRRAARGSFAAHSWTVSLPRPGELGGGHRLWGLNSSRV